MPRSNAPVAVTKISHFRVALFNNGPKSKLGVIIQQGRTKLMCRPGHARALRLVADWMEQQAAAQGRPILPSRDRSKEKSNHPRSEEVNGRVAEGR